MRLIHCADLHLDSKMSANLSKEKARERKAELLNTFIGMIQYAEENQVDGIIIAGDLYDTKTISATAKNAVRDAIVNHPRITFYYLRGNHDADNFLNHLETIPDNLKLFDDTWTIYAVEAVSGSTTGSTTGNTVSQADASREKEGQKNGSFASHIKITGVELNGNNYSSIYNTLSLDTEDFNIVVLHGQEAEHASKDRAETICLRNLRNKGIDYLALGHVHAYKKGALDSRGVYCYPGCLEGRGFDECGEHGFVVLDIDETKKTFTHRFVPLARRRLYELSVDISACTTTADIAEQIRRELRDADLSRDSLVKLVLTGNVDVDCEKNLDFLTKQFGDRFYFLKIQDETRLKVDYGAFALDESLKGEFVRMVGGSQLDEQEKAAIIRYGIHALMGEDPDVEGV